MAANLLFHIGYHKTATTWMQNKLFFPIHGYLQIMGHEEVSKYIVAPHGLEFDPGLAQDIINEKMKNVLNEQAPVISSEILSGNPFFGGRESDVVAERL